MMAAGTGMMMMNPTMALFPIMLAGASFAKVNIILCSACVVISVQSGLLHRPFAESL